MRPIQAIALILFACSPCFAQSVFGDIPVTLTNIEQCDFIGDFDGDGLPEFFVNADIASVYKLDGTVLLTENAPGRFFKVGDLNGDGLVDIGRLTEPVNQIPGLVWTKNMEVVSATGLVWSVPIATLNSGDPDALGFTSMPMDDVDGDGTPDFLITAPYPVEPGQNNRGRLYCHSGADGSLLWDVFGAIGANIGTCLVALGDLDVDGVGDFAVAERTLSYNDQDWRLLRGTDGQLIHTIGDCFAVGPANGTWLANDPGPRYIISTRYQDTRGARGTSSFVTLQSRYMYTSISSRCSKVVTGDFNADGLNDFATLMTQGTSSNVVVWRQESTVGLGSNAIAYNSFGRSNNDNDALFWRYGNSSSDSFRQWSITDDFSGDGFADMIFVFGDHIEVSTATGFDEYGANALTTMSMSYIPTDPTDRQSGIMLAAGAGAFAPGLIILGTEKADLLYGQNQEIQILVDIVGPGFLLAESVTFDQAGEWVAPVHLRQPALFQPSTFGNRLFLQALSTHPGVETSNGLELIFSN